MAFSLRKGERLSKGLPRLVRRQLRSAIDQLEGEPSSDTVHEVRKSIKKVRAILELVRDDFDVDRERKQLQRVAHMLSPMRDADAVAASANRIFKGSSELRAMVEHERVQQLSAFVREGHHDDAIKALKQVKRSAKHWDWKKTNLDSALAGVRRDYKRARKAMDEARATASGEAFHEWRKRVKTLWYAMRLLGSDGTLAARVSSLDHLQTWLGEDHNLVVMRRRIERLRRRDSSRSGDAIAIEVRRRQDELRRKALGAGAKLFKSKPKPFAKDLRAQLTP
ncbi:MAG TPA: CHAD domain-containing protein [Vicinamibacterales bacterium]|nr:CHAD domain-containing protein [Vicinamibacterales bacterium]